uniref:Uncharacterized protein n=1 Tax=Magallana gigas TaxID=29159 RepID=A0A8W8JI24_MAGGI
MFIFFWIYTVFKGSATQGPCKNSFKGCCPGSAWDSQNQKCEQCMQGFTGENCSSACPYPTYGRDCQELCNCSKDICDVITGCQSFTTDNRFSLLPDETTTKMAENSTDSEIEKPTDNDILLIYIKLIGYIDLVLFCLYCAVSIYDRKTNKTVDIHAIVFRPNRVYENIEIDFFQALENQYT